MTGTRDVLIGVDVGGTHTDVSVARGSTVVRGKALTSHDDYGRGVLEAIEVAASRLDLSLDDLLARAEALVNATTVVTNSLTELNGARVGVLITGGFKDTLRFAGGARRADYDDHKQLNPPDIVPRSCIEEIDERIVRNGSVFVELDEAQVRSAVRKLREREVTTLAVCFLWSFRNPVHERRAREIIHEEWPGVFVTLSSEIHPVIREHERFFSAIFNCFCHDDAARLLGTLGATLRSRGFQGELSFFAGAGGAITRDLALRFPILLLASGPAGGVSAATELGRTLGLANILVGDMGGTSFDTSLISESEPVVASRVAVAGLPTGISVLDVVSIGAGGGSLAWIDERGVPQVGPESAGSSPGPACYGRGGVQATVTDAAVAARLIDAENYLDGRVQLDREAAEAAVLGFGAPLGWPLERSVDAILALVTANMASALRGISVERGKDPRAFTMIGYGGTLPLFATQICERLSIRSLVVPANSSVFSAFGLLVAPFLRRYSRSVEVPLGGGSVAEEIAGIRAEMAGTATAESRDGGIPEQDLAMQWDAALRFMGQVFEVKVPLPAGELDDHAVAALEASFPEHYEAIYGPGTAWEGSSVMLVGLNLTVTAPRPRPVIAPAELTTASSPVVPKSHRDLLLPGGSWGRQVPCYDGATFAPGCEVLGPAIIDEHDTTMFVSEHWRCRRDAFWNYTLATAG